MPTLDPVATLDELLIEDPYGAATEEAMLVAGDWLQARGDPRGELIGLEQALARAPDRKSRIARRIELEAWLDLHEALMFGSLAWLRTRPSTLRYELRGGRLHHLYVDARRALTRAAGLELAELMQTLIAAPALRGLTNLQVRVRGDKDTATVIAAIERAGRHLPLETLIVSPTTRPLAHPARDYAGGPRKIFPNLWLTTRLARLTPLLEPQLPDPTTANELLDLSGARMTRALRIRIGRALTSGRELTTRAACDLIATQGDSGRVFLPTLDLLLRPQVSHAATWLLPALPTFPPWVRQLVPRVATITGNIDHYPIKLRSQAGTCLKKLNRM